MKFLFITMHLLPMKDCFIYEFISAPYVYKLVNVIAMSVSVYVYYTSVFSKLGIYRIPDGTDKNTDAGSY